MSTIDEKIDEAASFYGNAHAKNALRLNRDVTSFDKRAARFDTYDLETAFEQGANFALSHQWVCVEDAMPRPDGKMLLCRDSVWLALCTWDNGRFIDAWNGDVFMATHWLPIPPLPETRKEDEV